MVSSTNENKNHVLDLWRDEEARSLNPVEELVYRSNLLGADQRITNTGGGNTSAKLQGTDPLTGESVEVLWVKGSGGDLRTSTPSNFSSLYQEKLLALQPLYRSTTPNGVKTEIEDKMVSNYLHCTFNLNPRPSSIDTPLHSFIPARHIDHMHPNAVIAIAASRRSSELTREVFGEDIVWTSWQRPGFDLALVLQDICRNQPEAKGIILGQHGVINWADTCKDCYYLTLDIIEKAARFVISRDKGKNTFGGEAISPVAMPKREELLAQILPWLRGQISQADRFIVTIQADDAMLQFTGSADAKRLAELGTSCPDHFLRTKIKPLFVDWNPREEGIAELKEKLSNGLTRYRQDYADYYEKCHHSHSPSMRDPNPTVILIPGIGAVTFGKNKSESRVTAEFYGCAVEVMRGAEAIDEYISLPQQEAFDIEYWALEEAKLQRMPEELPLARRIVLVIGAGNGIGKETAFRLSAEGAHVVCADLDEGAAKVTARTILSRVGEGVGVAGTGISSCGNAVHHVVDVTCRESVQEVLQATILAYGGLDHVVVTSGIYVPPDRSGHVDDSGWKRTFDVNVHGAYIVADEVRHLFIEQGLAGSMVLLTSVNGVVSKRGSLAYDASKAAANHLVRELAIEFSPLVRVNGVAPATVVSGSTMFPRDRILASLTKYKIEFKEKETTESLRTKLKDFYARRTLTQRSVNPQDVAETIAFLLGDASDKTTGQILSVDGGLHEAFLR